MPVLVRALDNDEATIIMIDSNLQRKKILPIEKAFAYKRKLLETESPIEVAIADAWTRDVICISTATGRKHDFTLLKDSCFHFSPKTEALADKGYQGIANLHENSTAPVKTSKNRKLTAEERKNKPPFPGAEFILSISTVT